MKISRKIYRRIVFIVLGILSTLWFLFRVIPKPQRAAYPCMRAAAPIASGFVLYLIGITGSALFFKKAYIALRGKRIVVGSVLVVVMAVFISMSLLNSPHVTKANTVSISDVDHLAPNVPMGEAKGIFPGRVVWVFDPFATNEEMDPSVQNHSYWESTNTFQEEVDIMLSQGIQSLTGTTSDVAAWDSIFKFHNRQVGKGNIGYNSSEIIFLKLNATSGWTGNINTTNMTRAYPSDYYAISETSPQVVLAVLKQLIDVVGVPESKIYVGDPMKHIYEDIYQVFKAEFPSVHYLDNFSTFNGREIAEKSADTLIFYSDSSKVMTGAFGGDKLYKLFEDAEYILNIPEMKGHKHGGVTMFAKNNFGSQTRGAASHLHDGLVHTMEVGGLMRTDYGMYRVLVDFMGSKYTGKKMLVYIMDALYATDFELARPKKWQMAPFNNDWSSSLFLSFDPVAIESVGFDFIYSEFDGSYPCDTFAHMGAVDDYLEQAADSANWPDGVVYAPDGDGVAIGSLGTHEHWDSKTSKKYSRNLGTGDGIELVFIDNTNPTPDPDGIREISKASIVKVYPNPFTEYVKFENSKSYNMKVSIYSLDGKLLFNKVSTSSIQWDGRTYNGTKAASGNLIYTVYINNSLKQTGKLVYYQ